MHAFRVDLQHYHFKTLPFPAGSFLSSQNFQTLMRTQNAVVASNGGFFTPALEPLGLRVTLGEILSPLKTISWWSVFYIQNKTAHIVRQKYYQPKQSVEFAVEAGPLLVANGKVIPKPGAKVDARTAIGITTDGKVILLATENLLISVSDLAAVMQRAEKQGGLDCVDALNLDGGHSTQIYAKLPNFSLQVLSHSRVADAVLVVPNN